MAKVALLIGVSEYEPGLNPLPAAVRDIEAMRRVLEDPEMGGFDTVKLLSNPDHGTMQEEIDILFNEGRTRDDLVLLFFSGHGIKDAAGRLYFASRKTRKSAKGDLMQSTAVGADFVHRIMNGSRAKRQVIILDCCFSGAFDPALRAKDDGSVDLQTQLGAEGRAVLASSSSTQYSFEHEGADLSLYTRYLVEGIETGAGDRDSDGLISMVELHEYAACKVAETAPSMTPKIIVLKDKGFEIVLSKARVTDPKLKYRKIASRYANKGTIRPAGRAVLNTLRDQLGLTVEETSAIEIEVLRPYQERLANLQRYRDALIAEAEHDFPLSEDACEDLSMLQQMLGLMDEDILPFRDEVESQFIQKLAAYNQRLAQYQQALADTIQREFPLKQRTLHDLQMLQHSLKLREEDIARVAHPLIQDAERRYQDKLKDEQQRQNQYMERFSQAIDSGLSKSVRDELEMLRLSLNLDANIVKQMEIRISSQKAAEYEEQQLSRAQQKQIRDQQRQDQYEKRFSQAIDIGLSKSVRDELEKLRLSLNLDANTVKQMESRISAQKAAEYEEQQLSSAQQQKPGSGWLGRLIDWARD